MRWAWVLVALVLATGIAGTVVSLRDREGNSQFTAEQRSPEPVTGPGIEAIILTTRDPRPGHAGKVRSADCHAGSASPLGNPWSCVVRYPTPPIASYRVSVHADGSIFGRGQSEGSQVVGDLTLNGCCVTTP
jgi:hypothetical protein